MSYTFDPMSDEEIEAMNIIPEGEYNFEVVKSTRKQSKSGNSMAELQNMIWDKEGKTHLVFDYLVFSKVPLNIKKVKHFCDSVGLGEEYKQGSLPEELERYCGKCLIGIKEEQPNPNGGMYPKKNIVVDYLISNKMSKNTVPQDFVDDETIPF